MRLRQWSGAMLLWRVRKDLRLPCEKRLPDGSYFSRVYPSQPDQKRGTNGIIDQKRSGMNNLSGDKATRATAPLVR